MNHHGLFIKLMEKQIPAMLLCVIEHWFSIGNTCVKWGTYFSQSFKLCTPRWRIIYTRQRSWYFARTPELVCLSVCLSVCQCARLLKNAFMDLDEMLRVDRCRDMDELINF